MLPAPIFLRRRRHSAQNIPWRLCFWIRMNASISEFLKKEKKRKKKKRNWKYKYEPNAKIKRELNNVKWNMLLYAHDFCAMANHFSVLGLGRSGEITDDCGQHFLQICLKGRKNWGTKGTWEGLCLFRSGWTCLSLCETESSSVCLVALRASGHADGYWAAIAGAWESNKCWAIIAGLGCVV